MLVERIWDPASNSHELWLVSEERSRKTKVGTENSIDLTVSPLGFAVCWASGRTIGNAEIVAENVLCDLTSSRGDCAVLACDLVYAGKFRHGANRWWCRTHQSHWGVKSDIARLVAGGGLVCKTHTDRMSYVRDPYVVELEAHAEVGVWCSMPAALSTHEIIPRSPKIHLHIREKLGQPKSLDKDFGALVVTHREAGGLFDARKPVSTTISPPGAFEFVRGIGEQKAFGSVDCNHCGYPHLDLGSFGETPHRKHFCANCGRDSMWSKSAIVATPLAQVHTRYPMASRFETPNRTLNLDDYRGCSYTVWASTPAIVWTADRPQEYGIHVHVHDGTHRIIDDTYAAVSLAGRPLDRSELLQMMVARSIV